MNLKKQEMLQEAVAKFHLGEFERAEKIITYILKNDEKNLPSIKILALIKIVQKKYKEASVLLQKAIDIDPNDPSTIYNLSKTLMECEEYEKSVIYHERAIRLMPHSKDAWLNFSITLFRLDDFEGALGLIEHAIKINPNDVSILINKTLILNKLKKIDEALCIAKKNVKINHESSEAWQVLGSCFNAVGSYQEALNCFDNSLKINSQNSDALINKGNTFLKLRMYEKALCEYEKALQIKQNLPEAWSNRSVALLKLESYDEAYNSVNKALSFYPKFVEALTNKGAILNSIKNFRAAIDCLDNALNIKSDHVEAILNKGNSIAGLQKFNEALSYFQKVISIDPRYEQGWYNKGKIHHKLLEFSEALDSFDRAIKENQNSPEAWSAKGAVLQDLSYFNEALTCYETALSLDSNQKWILGDSCFINMRINSWTNYHNDLFNIFEKLKIGKKVIQPFTLLALTDNLDIQHQCARIYSEYVFPARSELGKFFHCGSQQKIRIGYFSADFRVHPVSRLTVELFELHDRSKFEVIGFSTGSNDDSPLFKRLSAAFDSYFDLKDKTDLEIAKLARDLGIDIAVDLGGYTDKNRTEIFSYRAAPIQVSYIGFLGTMGASYIDYLIADKILIPENLKKFYSEKIAYIPSYQVNDRKRVVSEKKFNKAELGIPESSFLFCCFNNNYKITPNIYDSWMKILNAISESYLYLYVENSTAESNLKKEAERRGISSNRIIFAKSIPYEEYLARFKLCDLFLDTFPYNAGTTASDALWAGLPLITLQGQSFASRIASSLLIALDIPELIVKSQNEYESLAIELANNPIKLDCIKQKVATNKFKAALFDTPSFTNNLEKIFFRMHQKNKDGLMPEDIDIF